MLEGKTIPKSHHIDDLAQELQVAPEVIDDVLELTADYMLARYPDVADLVPYETYDAELAREKVTRAQRILAQLKPRIQRLEEETNHEGSLGGTVQEGSTPDRAA